MNEKDQLVNIIEAHLWPRVDGPTVHALANAILADGWAKDQRRTA